MTVAVASCYASAPAWALNEADFKAVIGSFTASQTGNVNVLTLTTATNRTLVETQQRFNVGANEQFRVLQPSSSSLFLLRVMPGANGALERSVIDGSIYSNGQFWLQNAAGALISKGAVIDTAGFLATTLPVRIEDFLAARLTIQGAPGIGNIGNIENHGTIKTHSGGSVYLVGANVTNEGVITTPGGETILAAGQTVSFADTGTPGVKVEITGAAGNVTNLGEIVATAGRIGMAGVIVRNSGTLNASSVVSEGGRVFLKASKDAYVDGAGRIVATGTTGGKVEVLGERVAVMDQAQIDVSGTSGGGTVLVGGDYQGKNPDIQNATVTYFGAEASIKADAIDNGDGGKVIVWADDTTRAYGSISARGGANGGNGGFVETSGRQYLEVSGARVDTRAAKGKIGNWLLDPMNVSIVSGAYAGAISANPFAPSGGTTTTITDADINDYLTSTNLTIQTDGAGTGSGNISITNASISGSGNSLYLLAYGGAGGTGDITVQGSTLSNLATLAMVAGWDGVGTTESDVIANTGNLSISASTIGSAVGIVNLYGGGNITFGSTSATTGTAVTSTAQMVIVGKNVTAYGSTSASAYDGTTHYGAGVWLKSGGAQTIKADTSSGYVSLYGGEVSSVEGGQLNYGGSAIFESAGNQTVTAYGIRLKGGATGHDNAANLEAYGNQAVTVYAGGIGVYGGGGSGSYNNFAQVKQKSGISGGQTITTFNGGSIYISGGTGTGTGGFYDAACGTACKNVSSNNGASIRNNYGNQTVDFIGGGNLTLVGGSGGANNEAQLENESVGLQQIYSSSGNSANTPVISITGGSSGGTLVLGSDAKYHMEENSAGISAGSDTAGPGSQQIYAKSITVTAGGNSSTYAGAYIGAYGTSLILAYGDVSLTGGAGTAQAQERFTTAAGIGSDKTATVTLAIYGGGKLTMTGGSGTGGAALIGSTDYGATVAVGVYGGDVSLTANKGAAMIGSAQTAATATATQVSIGASGHITLTASSDTTGHGDVMIGSYGGNVSGTQIIAGGNLTTSSPGKNVRIGQLAGTSSGSGMVLRAGSDFTDTLAPFAASGTGGNLSLGSGTTVKEIGSLGVTLSAQKGTAYAGDVSVSGAVSSSAGQANAHSYGSMVIGGSLYGGNGIYMDSGFDIFTTGASSSGGNMTLQSGSSVTGYGAGVQMRAMTNGSIIQNSGSSIVASGAVNIQAAQNVTLNSVVSLTSAQTVNIKAGYNGSIYSPGYTATLGTISSQGGIDVKAGGAILDGNGSSGNLSGTSVALTSYYGGAYGGLAISSDISLTAVGATVAGTVESTATYGGISIRNGGSQVPTSVSLYDYSTNPGSGEVTYASTSSINMLTAGLTLWSDYGGVVLWSGGDIVLNNLTNLRAGVNDANYRYIKISGQNITAGAAMTPMGLPDLYINANGTLQLTNFGIGTDLSTGARKLGLNAVGGLSLTNSKVYASQDVYLGGVNKYGGGSITLANTSAAIAGNSIYAYTGGDIRLNDGSYFSAGNDVNLGLGSTTSTVYLNDSASYASSSYILVGAAYGANVAYLTRSADGIVIDGVATKTSAAYGSGIFRGTHGNPASQGAGLNTLYGVAASAAITQAVNDVVSTITTTTTSATSAVSDSSTSSGSTANIPPPTTTTTTSGGILSLSSGTVGGAAGQFGDTSGSGSSTTTTGGTTTGTTSTTSTSASGTTSGDSSGGSTSTTSTSTSGDSTQSSSTSGDQNGSKDAKDEKKEDKKDDKSKKADSGEKRDDKTKQKPVGKCSA